MDGFSMRWDIVRGTAVEDVDADDSDGPEPFARGCDGGVLDCDVLLTGTAGGGGRVELWMIDDGWLILSLEEEEEEDWEERKKMRYEYFLVCR